MQKLAWLSDGCVSLSGFSAEPHLAAAFSGHHGLFHIYSIPCVNFLRPPSDKLSVLRGLSASSSKETGLSENNLAFRCTRKRLVIETLHLDVEGGVSERRTTTSAIATSEVPTSSSNKGSTAGSATMEIEVEQKDSGTSQVSKAVKPKKKVGFITEKPDIYDF